MKTRVILGAAAAVLIAACTVVPVLLPATGAAAATTLSGHVAVQGGAIVTTAHVPQSADPVHVARDYRYDLYATCWNRHGDPQARYVQRVGTGGVPVGAGDALLRVPPDDRTTFTFSDAVAGLVDRTAARPLPCPKRFLPGLLRLVVTDWTVTVVHFDGTSRTASGSADVTVDFPAP